MRNQDSFLAEIFRDNDPKSWHPGDILINRRLSGFFQIVRQTLTGTIVRPVASSPAPPAVHPWTPGYVSVSRGCYLPQPNVFMPDTRERRATSGYARWDEQLALPALDFSI